MFNDEEQDVTPETVTEEVVETEEVETPEEPEVPVEPAVDWEKEAKRLQAELGRKQREFKKEVKKVAVAPEVLAVEDYIDISTSLDGLDPREKARLAEEHRNTGRPLKEIRESEDYQLWQTAYRMKQEKENALKPNTAQAVEDGPKSMLEKLRTASFEEKEAMLKEAGLYKEHRPRADRTGIGVTRTR